MAEKLRFYSSSADNLDAMAVETDSSVATPSNVKDDYLFKDANTRELLIGTMPINPPETILLDLQDIEGGVAQYIIPKGYHDGTGKVISRKLKDYTPGNATPEDVVNNKIFWVNGEKKIGTLNIEMADQVATATENDLLEGVTAWVNKKKITGTIPRLPRTDKILLSGESYIIPYGLSAGTTVIKAAPLTDSTPGTAIKSDLINGKTAWVNGKKIIGSLNLVDKISEILKNANAKQNQVLKGKNFYSTAYNQVVSGTMPDHSGQSDITIPIGQAIAIPEGYYDGVTKVSTKSLEDATQGSAVDKNILVGKTAWVNGKRITGTMLYNGPKEIQLDSGTKFYIPEGYHTGNGFLSVKPLDKQTIGSATEDDILLEKVAWVNGSKIIGKMPKNSDLDKSIAPGETFYVPKGFHSGTGTVWVKPLKTFTPGDAASKDIRNGKTAWVNGEKVIGTMTEVEPEEIVLDAGARYAIPEGYHDGTGTVEAESIEVQTPGNAKESDILKSKTAWVNGVKITGNLELTGTAVPGDVIDGSTFYNIDTGKKLTGTLKLIGTAKEEDVLEGTSFYSDNPKRKLTGSLKLIGTATSDKVLLGESFYNTDAKKILAGTMPNNAAQVIRLESDGQYIIPEGYHDGNGIVKAPTLSSVTEADADASDIVKDKTAWVNGVKLTGTMVLDGTATPDKVVAGYTYYSSNPKQKLTGTMYTIPAQINKIFAGESYTIPAGVHEGKGQVYAASLKEQTVADAISGDILINKTAWVNGIKLIGTMPSNPGITRKLNAGEVYTVPYGFHSSVSTIIANDLSSQTEADSIADDILVNKTAWVNGVKIIGTMVDNGSITKVIDCGESFTIPKGYHDGTGSISVESLASKTVADATAGDIISPKTAWVNGVKITGTVPTRNTSVVRINSGNNITLPAGYYPDGITIYSLYTDRLDLTGTNAWYEEADQALHPEDSGYVDGESLVVTATITV